MNKKFLTTTAMLWVMTLSTGALAESYISYDEDGNITAARLENTNGWAVYKEYNTNGQLRYIVYEDTDGTQAATEYSYKNGQISEITTTKSHQEVYYTPSASANSLVDEEIRTVVDTSSTTKYDYDYNEDGTIKTKTITDSSSGKSETYEYSYEEDPDGSRYVKANNMLVEAYDSEGRLVYTTTNSYQSPFWEDYYESTRAVYVYNEDGTFSKLDIPQGDLLATVVRTDYDQEGNILGLYSQVNVLFQPYTYSAYMNARDTAQWTEIEFEKDASGKITSVDWNSIHGPWNRVAVNYAEPLYRIYTAEQAYAATSKGNNNSISIRFK